MMTAKNLGFIQGAFTAQGPSGNVSFTPAQNKNFIAIEIDGPWVEAIGQAAIAAGVAEMAQLLAGQGTVEMHTNTILSLFGNVPASIATAAQAVAAGVDSLIGKKVTLANAAPVAMAILGQVGIVPASTVTTVDSAVASLQAYLAKAGTVVAGIAPHAS